MAIHGRHVLVIAGVGAWLAAAAGGMAYLATIESTPGAAANAPALWPANSQLTHGSQPQLVVFIHPHCPCSRATLDELAAVLSACEEPPRTTIVFDHPSQAPADWDQSPLHQRAAALRGVTLCSDAGSVESRRFGVFTSGQALYYDAAGCLRFAGGLTRARGVRGSSEGGAVLLARLQGHEAEAAQSDVFGCPLCHAESSP